MMRSFGPSRLFGVAEGKTNVEIKSQIMLWQSGFLIVFGENSAGFVVFGRQSKKVCTRPLSVTCSRSRSPSDDSSGGSGRERTNDSGIDMVFVKRTRMTQGKDI